MIVNLSTDQTRTVEPMRSFVEGIELAEIAGAYALISRTLERVLYPRLGKAGKGAVKRFLEKATSLSRSQVTRLIGQHRRSRDSRDHREKPPARPFPRRYTPGDIALLAEVDEAYGQLSGPATMEVLRRHYEVHGDERFQRLASISNIPLLEALITAFPVTVEAFHADNGSEYINHRVAELLTKLHIGTFTKSRARRSNDNALVESRNGSVVRKWLGHIYVPAPLAPRVNAFLRDTLPPFLNFHRPCLLSVDVTSATGRVVRKRYPQARVALPRTTGCAA